MTVAIFLGLLLVFLWALLGIVLIVERLMR